MYKHTGRGGSRPYHFKDESNVIKPEPRSESKKGASEAATEGKKPSPPSKKAQKNEEDIMESESSSSPPNKKRSLGSVCEPVPVSSKTRSDSRQAPASKSPKTSENGPGARGVDRSVIAVSGDSLQNLKSAEVPSNTFGAAAGRESLDTDPLSEQQNFSRPTRPGGRLLRSSFKGTEKGQKGSEQRGGDDREAMQMEGSENGENSPPSPPNHARDTEMLIASMVPRKFLVEAKRLQSAFNEGIIEDREARRRKLAEVKLSQPKPPENAGGPPRQKAETKPVHAKPREKEPVRPKKVKSKSKASKKELTYIHTHDDYEVCRACGKGEPKVKTRVGSTSEGDTHYFCRHYECWQYAEDTEQLCAFHGQPLCAMCLRGFMKDGQWVHKAARATFIHNKTKENVCAGHFRGKEGGARDYTHDDD